MKLSAPNRTLACIGVLMVPLCAAPASAQDLRGMDQLNAIHCGKGHQPPCPPPPAPYPIIAFNPANPSLPDNSPVGAPITQIVVTMSDGSLFTGSIGFGPPYSSDGGICAVSGQSLIVGAALPAGNSTQNCTITATQ